MKTKPTPATHDIQEHPLVLRIAHWLQALAIIVMIGSGWRIYNSSPIFGEYRFPLWATLGGDPMQSKIAHMDPGVANALNWHFTGLWLLLASYLLFIGHRRHLRPFPARLPAGHAAPDFQRSGGRTHLPFAAPAGRV